MEKQVKKNKIAFRELFKLATKKDIIHIIIGTISALLNGMMQPLFGQLFGEMAQKFSPENNPDEIFQGSAILAGYFILVGGLSFILSCSMLYCWINAGENQAINLRQAYYNSMIQQDIKYFDSINANEISTKVALDCFKIQQAIGEKLCMNLYTFSMLAGSLIISFVRGWQIALVSCIIIPIVWYSCKFLTWVSNGVVKKTSQSYQEAGGIAEQALSSIRTIKSLNGEEFESERYNNLMFKAYKVSLKYSIFTGIAFGFQNMMLFFDFSLTFWVGSLFIENQITNQNMGREYYFSDVIVVFLSIVLTSFRLGGATDSIKYFEEAQIAGYDLFQILDRTPIIHENKMGKLATELGSCQITFENLKFSYPNRQDVIILNDLNIQLQHKKRTAIVGKSGCGKSTIIQLLERFYNPVEGRILIDGIEIQEFQLNSLRQAIGYVSQGPILFGTSIRENLRYAKPDATEEEMIDALKRANIWSFVEKQQNKLDTFVGQNGTQLSGGQKQRICIARAIIKKPKIFLLDEATSALDAKNEALIQQTLDEVTQGITTIVIAHRLSTVQSADEIVVIDSGAIVERGTHQQLMNKKNYYFNFVKKQEEVDLNNQQSLKLNNSIEKEEGQDNIKDIIKLERPESIQTAHLFTVQNLNTVNQLCLIDNELMKQQSTKQLISIPTENLITEFKTEECELKNYFKSSQEQQEKVEDEYKKQYTFGEMMNKLLSYNKNQIKNALLGAFFSIGNGIAYPFCGWVFGNIASILLNPNTDDFREKCNEYSIYFALVGLVDLISLTLQYFFQSKITESLTYSLRCDLFQKTLNMPIKWFDLPQNNSGAIAQSLFQDCKNVNILVGTNITFNIANISSLLCAILLGLSADWRTTLVGLILMPLIILASVLYAIRMNMFNSKMNQSSLDTAQLINQSACNIRTVASLGNPDYLCNNFKNILTKNYSNINKSAFLAGIAIGLTNLCLFGVYGIIFLSGASFHRDYNVDIKDILISILCLMFAALGISKNTEFMGDAGASLDSANKIFNTLESQDEKQFNQGQFESEEINGEITFDNVSFKYPQREAYVLKNVSFKIPSRSKIAFVGPSGSGKSSIIQLIQRFYTNYEGKILLDGVDLKQYNLQKYRTYFGVVQQEPILFNGSIKQNIVYNTKNITEKDISNASQMASALQFIQTFKEGFNKQVGLGGSQISGGQKQRIAISRMILKKPQVMLLDEATSALDSQNEQIVQESLIKLLQGKTSINVAHRISTIKDSDIIFVLDNGQIVEQGDYQTLLDKKNHFYKLLQNSKDESLN